MNSLSRLSTQQIAVALVLSALGTGVSALAGKAVFVRFSAVG